MRWESHGLLTYLILSRSRRWVEVPGTKVRERNGTLEQPSAAAPLLFLCRNSDQTPCVVDYRCSHDVLLRAPVDVIGKHWRWSCREQVLLLRTRRRGGRRNDVGPKTEQVNHFWVPFVETSGSVVFLSFPIYLLQRSLVYHGVRLLIRIPTNI